MFFNSLAFGLFLPTVVALFWMVPRAWRTGLLLAASYVFYGWWDYRFLSLIVISTVTDYLVGLGIFTAANSRTRKYWLWLSLLVNLGILAFFKYWGFFVDSAVSLLGDLGVDPGRPLLSVVLPVGISFYTFQTLSYSIDVYRRQLDPERNIVKFGLFVAFFPQLVAGPIERARRLLPQLNSFPGHPREIDWIGAFALILRGLFRKVVIADGVAPIVNEVFSKPDAYLGLSVAAGVLAFSLQIYGDFAGYTDIARGVAKLFGVELMVNFRAPYTATGFRDFWRRWHISLSTWLRDYLYIPLGGNQSGVGRNYANLMVTMLLGGLWHGAGWGFVAWGFLHGSYLVIERIFRDKGDGQWLSAPLVFTIVTLTWIPFRAPDLDTAWRVLTGIFNFGGASMTVAPLTVGFLGILTMVIDSFDERGIVDPTSSQPAITRGFVYGLAAVAVLLFSSRNPVPFIYFQF